MGNNNGRVRMIVLFMAAGLLLDLSGPAQRAAEAARTKRPMMGQDSFGLSVCTEVPKELVAKTLGKPVPEIFDFSTATDTGCKYYTNRKKQEYALVSVVYLNAENQKKGQKVLGRAITTSGRIGMVHFIAMQKDGTINAIYLVMAPGKYIRIDRSSRNAAGNEQLLELAVKVAELALYK
jgi:hypothetical protein